MFHVPSGKHTKNDGKSPFGMGKSTFTSTRPGHGGASRQAPGASAKTNRRVSLGDDEQPRSKSGHGDVPSESMSTGWWFGTCFYFPFHIWDVILPIDELIFFKISYFSRWLLHHQPVKVCQSWVLNFRNVGLTMTKKLG